MNPQIALVFRQSPGPAIAPGLARETAPRAKKRDYKPSIEPDSFTNATGLLETGRAILFAALIGASRADGEHRRLDTAAHVQLFQDVGDVVPWTGRAPRRAQSAAHCLFFCRGSLRTDCWGQPRYGRTISQRRRGRGKWM